MSNAKKMTRQARAWQAILEELNRRTKEGPRGTLSRLAEELGVERGTVSRWINGGLQGKRVSYDQMVFIMRKLGLDPAEYFDPTPSPRGEVPLIGLAACGYDSFTAERRSMTAPAPDGEAEESGMFAVMALGPSMLPAGVAPGFLAYCDPGREAEIGDMVLVERKNGTLSLKMYGGAEGAWTLLQGWLPPDATGIQQPYTSREETDAIARVAPVVYIKRKL